MKKKIKQIVILNGGEGKRVRKISKNKPKCLIKFNGSSFLKLQINFLIKKGFKKFLILTKKKNNLIKRELRSMYTQNIELSIYSEKTKLGTGGAIKNAISKLDNNFAVIYGDSWLDFNVKKTNYEYLKSKKNYLITAISKKVVKHKPNLLIKKNKIIQYSKKNYLENNFIEYGYQIFSKRIFKEIDKKIFDLNLVVDRLIDKNDVKIFFVKNRFYEIGSLNGIKEFKRYIET